MALPELLMPGSLPRFLNAGHGQTRQSIYSPVEPGTGTFSKRPMATRGSRFINVAQMLTNEQVETFEGWFHHTLEVGTKHWAANVASTEEKAEAWFDAVWVAPPQYDPRGPYHWMVSGQIEAFGEASTEPPEITGASVEFSLVLTGFAEATVSNEAQVEFGLSLVSFDPAAGVEFTFELKPAASRRRVTSTGDVRVTSVGDTRVTGLT